MPVLAEFIRVEAAIDTCPQLKRVKDMEKDEQDRALCPCCKKPLQGLLDIIQWGMWDDKYTTYLYCKDCDTAFEYKYQISAVVPERFDYEHMGE